MNIDKLILVGEIHKKIRVNIEQYLDQYKQKTILLLDLANYIEFLIEEETKNIRSINRNIAFPIGLNKNNIVAHYTPNINSIDFFNINNDMIKIDYGIHYDGNIIDSAFTYCNNNKLDNIKNASKDAVKNVIKEAGVDCRLIELSYIAKEIIESYEYNNIPLSVVDNVASHNIDLYKIHGNKLIYGNPSIQQKECNIDEKMLSNELYAIEFYATNGNNNIKMTNDVSHYMVKNYEQLKNYKVNNKNTKLLKDEIIKNYKELPFCQRYINYYNPKIKINRAIKDLYNNEHLIYYPPIIDDSLNTFISQFEDTIFITESNVINLSKNSE